ncbi:hypothetical protein LINPERHAP1_LOCUS2335 [Linum perenne]
MMSLLRAINDEADEDDTGLIQHSKCYLRSLESGMEGFGKKQLLIINKHWASIV